MRGFGRGGKGGKGDGEALLGSWPAFGFFSFFFFDRY